MAKKEICDICKMWCQLPGKFEGNTSCQKRAEAIYEVAQSGCDAETGSVTEDGVGFGVQVPGRSPSHVKACQQETG
jgi:hypothetical protein